jgi:hypothetical protein
MQATRRLVLHLCRFVGDPQSQHCYRLESICHVAIDLCIHQFRCRLCPALVLSLAVVVRRAVHTPPSGHHPISAIPNHFGLTRVHLSSWFLISFISVHFSPSLGVVSVHGHVQHLVTILMGLS